MVKVKEFYFRKQQYQFVFRAKFFVFCAFFIVLFFVLSHWQFQRYHYKKQLLDTYQQRTTAQPQLFPLISLIQKDLRFLKVKFEGFYLNEQTMLVQNQFYQDQIGYEVLTPFKVLGQNKMVIVDRGWIPRGSSQQLPVVPNADTVSEVVGQIKYYDEYQFILGKNILNKLQKPLVMQKVDMNELQDDLQESLYPFVLRLDATQPNGFVRQWEITNVIPERHLGYAFQWIAMAVALIIAYIFSCIQKISIVRLNNETK